MKIIVVRKISEINPLSTNPTKWSNTLKIIHWLLPAPQNGQTHSNNSSAFANCLSMFDHFVGLALKRLRKNHTLISLLILHLILIDKSVYQTNFNKILISESINITSESINQFEPYQRIQKLWCYHQFFPIIYRNKWYYNHEKCNLSRMNFTTFALPKNMST